MIVEEVEECKWDCMKADRKGPKISHLMFADDLLLFGKAFENQMRIIKGMLDKFCLVSHQRISYEKYSFLFCKNTDPLTRKQILEKLINQGFILVCNFQKEVIRLEIINI